MAVERSGGNDVAPSQVSSQTYDSGNGRTCHQCRQKISDFAAACKNKRSNKPCSIKLCQMCLLNRYGEKAEEVVAFQEWSCPKCRGICNCSVCMKRRGHQPTGVLIITAKATGFSSVSEMLLKGAKHLKQEKVGACMAAPLKKEIAFSPRKRGKENTFDGKLDSNLPESVDKNFKKVKQALNHRVDETSSKIINQGQDKRKENHEELEDIRDYMKNAGNLSNETGSCASVQKPKKMKHDKVDETSNGKNDKRNLRETGVHGKKNKPKRSRGTGLEENDDRNEKDLSTARSSASPKKLEVSNELSDQVAKSNSGVDFEENENCILAVTRKDLVGTVENDKKKSEEGGNTANVNGFLEHQSADYHVDIPLPVGTVFTSVAGIDGCAEDVGNVLQFLEFCSVFRKILDVKKGQPEHVLQDLLHGRSTRRGKFSATVQFHIHLLSVIRIEQGEEGATLSPSYGKNSWFHTLKKCLSESQSVFKAQGVDSLEEAVDYETLDASEKLRVLNFLCDEVLETEKVRNWINNQNIELAQKVKEAKQKVIAAKDMERILKQKMKDEIAKAIIARNGVNISISEQEAIVSCTKSEVAQAHAKLLESREMLLKSNQASNAVRIEPIFVDHLGQAYWKLNCCGKSNLLCQNTGKRDALTIDERWFALDIEGKEVTEKHISSLR